MRLPLAGYTSIFLNNKCMNKKILLYVVSVDEIEPAISERVATLAKALSASVYLLGRMGPRYELWQASPEAGAELTAKLELISRRIRSLRASIAGIDVIEGNLTEQCLMVAEQIAASAIAIGCGEAVIEKPEHIRATAQRIARHADQDVWIIKPHSSMNLDHLLCPIDGSEAAAHAMRCSIELSRHHNARLMALSVLHPPPEYSLASFTAAGNPDNEASQVLAKAKAALVAKRSQFLRGFDFAGVPLAQKFIWADKASPAILEMIDKHRDGLTVLGLAGHQRFSRVSMGDTAERVLAQCSSNLLITRNVNRT